MSSDRAAFLRAICESPEDDLPRLVYADWLDEHGDHDRAEFIRLQIGLANDSIPGAAQAGAEARAAELLARHRAAWVGGLPRPRGVTWGREPVPLARGFVDAVEFRFANAWRRHAEEVFAAAPISWVRVGGEARADVLAPVLESPLLGRLTGLAVQALDPAGAEALAANPHLTGRLRWLCPVQLEGDRDGVAAALSRAPGLRNLEAVGFSELGLAGLTALARSPHLTRLKLLGLNRNSTGDAGAEVLAASPNLVTLERLSLIGCDVSDRGVAALAGSPHLTSLRALCLGDTHITDAGAAVLAAAAGLPRLTELHLWGTRIGEAGAAALAEFADRRGLQTLDLQVSPPLEKVFREMARWRGPRFDT